MAFRIDSVLRFVLQAVWLVLLLCASQTDSNPKPEIAKIQSNKVNHHSNDDDDDDDNDDVYDDYDDDDYDDAQVAKRQLDTYGSPVADPQIDSYGPPSAPICQLQVFSPLL